MHELEDEQNKVVAKEIEEHLKTLQTLRSRKLGGPSVIIILPYGAMVKTFRDDWKTDDAAA